MTDTAWAGPVYPGRTWAKKTPAEAGLDIKALRAYSDFTGGFGCVIRQGHLVDAHHNLPLSERIGAHGEAVQPCGITKVVKLDAMAVGGACHG